MIGYLSGKVKFLFGESCILDVGGVGYNVTVDEQTRHESAVKEDAINLYGFKNRETFELFEMLLTVSGIGAKSALSIVSKISAADFAATVIRQDLKTLTRLPGVGKKSAERILLELKDKVKSLSKGINNLQQPVIKLTVQDEATEALEALGYTAAEISEVFAQAPANATTEQLIKFALKELNRFA